VGEQVGHWASRTSEAPPCFRCDFAAAESCFTPQCMLSAWTCSSLKAVQYVMFKANSRTLCCCLDWFYNLFLNVFSVLHRYFRHSSPQMHFTHIASMLHASHSTELELNSVVQPADPDLVLSSCPTLHGVLPTPYWWVVLSFVLVIMGGVLWNVISGELIKKAKSVLPPLMAELLPRQAQFDGCIGQITAVECLKSNKRDNNPFGWTARVRGLHFEHPGGDKLFIQLSPAADIIPMTYDQMRQALQHYVAKDWKPGQLSPSDLHACRLELVERVGDGEWRVEGPYVALKRLRVGQFAFLDLTYAKDQGVPHVASLLYPSFNYCMLLLFVGCAHFLYILATPQSAYLSSQPQTQYYSTYATDGGDAAWSPLNSDGSSAHDYPLSWLTYEQLYVRVINSGWLTLWSTMFFGHGREQLLKPVGHSDRPAQILKYTGGFSLALLLPFVLTHALPALVIFPWLPLCILVLPVIYICSTNDDCMCYRNSGTSAEIGRIVMQRACFFPLVILLQTACHYGVLLYAQPIPLPGGSWSDIINAEYSLRSSSCYFDAITRQTHSLIAFLSYF
jgi:hypothetical protein